MDAAGASEGPMPFVFGRIEMAGELRKVMQIRSSSSNAAGHGGMGEAS